MHLLVVRIGVLVLVYYKWRFKKFH